MYHRVAELPSDIWQVAVTPANFEQHVRWLTTHAQVLPLAELVEQLKNKRLQRNAVALTFDDGYADNYLVAKPILDEYKVPVTFFVASGGIDQETEFWWDELESLLLFTPHLPLCFDVIVADQPLHFDLSPSEIELSEGLRRQHAQWDACTQSPPTHRSTLFLQLWQLLRPLPHDRQQQSLDQIRQWARVSPSTRPAYRSMRTAQLLDLGRSQLHDLGAHTVHHPALAAHAPAYQRQELLQNKAYLEGLTGREISLVAYPYGNYNLDTLAVAAGTGFAAGFTTEAKPVSHRSDPYRLGRFQVPNVPGSQFAEQLQRWQRQT